MPVGDVVGFAVIAGSRIIVPAEIATIDASAQIPAIATIWTIQFANIRVGTVEVGTISVLLAAGTEGTILFGYVTDTIAGGAIGNVGAIATIGTLRAGNVSATILSCNLDYGCTIIGTIRPIESVGTI